MWIWRRLERVKWADRMRNEAVLERVGEERMMLKLIRKRKGNWLGHWMRRNCLLKDALEGMVNGRRVRGRRRYQMIDDNGYFGGAGTERVFENKVLRKIFGAKRDEVTGEWRKLHNAELHALYTSPDIIRNIKSRRLRWARHVARMGESRNAYRVLVGRPEGKRPLGRARNRWEDNIKMDLREVGYDGRDWINLAQDRDQWRAYVRAAMNLRLYSTSRNDQEDSLFGFLAYAFSTTVTTTTITTTTTTTTKKLKEELDIPNLLQPLMIPQNPLQIDIIQSEIDLLEQITKNQHSKENLKQLALETVNIRYPEDYWIRIYTDGSKTDPQENVGAGIFSNIFCFYLPVGYNLSAYDGEIEAIHVALNQLLFHMDKFTNAVILSDSKAAILSINKTGHPYTEQINNCQKILATLKERGKTVALQWIPGHCNLHGNEQADTLAKKGANLKINPRKPLSFNSVKQYIKQLQKINHQQELDILQQRRKLLKDIPPEPRRLAVASFRLNTEHDILGKHLNRLGILPSASCILCHQQEDMDRQHLAKCPALKSSTEVDRYWEARARMFLIT
ncbi:hypothetical protein ANN_13581 [Periplaneta americana]|uniref:ribonuclease H n=1 Tax=Periplaneta americana TaxID=6978 RepID=A0ABQ8TLT6_PERAM|nr:hypothetical protein ANN_13581 [Periplaneta americana]